MTQEGFPCVQYLILRIGYIRMEMSDQMFEECTAADLLYLGIPGASALKCVMLSFIRGEDLLVGR